VLYVSLARWHKPAGDDGLDGPPAAADTLPANGTAPSVQFSSPGHANAADAPQCHAE
jgi:hypothetical protein